MKKLILIFLMMASQPVLASNQKLDCYQEMTKEIGRDRAALLCNSATQTSLTSTLKDCYQFIVDQKIEKNRASILCHNIKSMQEVKIVLHCYSSLSKDIAYSRAAVLCSGLKNLAQVENTKSCYMKASKTISRERAAMLCSKSSIAATELSSF